MQEETFGPVLVVQTAHDSGRLSPLQRHKARARGGRLRAVSPDIARRFLDEAEAGILKVNQSTAGAAIDAPFGGWKASGVGVPEHGRFDLEFFTRPQTIDGGPRRGARLAATRPARSATRSGSDGQISRTKGRAALSRGR